MDAGQPGSHPGGLGRQGHFAAARGSVGHGSPCHQPVAEQHGRIQRRSPEEPDRLRHAGGRRECGCSAIHRARSAAVSGRGSAPRRRPICACSTTNRSASCRQRARPDHRAATRSESVRELWTHAASARVAGRVGHPTMGRPAHPRVRAPHRRHRRVHLRHGAVRGRGHVVRGSRQASQRVLAVARVVGNAGHHLRMGRLDQQRADAPDERRHITHELPGDRARTEEPRISGVTERVGKGVIGMREQPLGLTDDPGAGG